MNSVGQPLQQRPLTKRLIFAGIIGLIVFLMFQVVPQLYSGGSASTISKTEARDKAAAFAAQQLGHSVTEQDHWTVSYQTDSSFYGYMSQEKLLQSYTDNKLDQRYPFDVYHAVLYTGGAADPLLAVDLNMYTGEVTAFALGGYARSSDGWDYGDPPASGTLNGGLSLQQKETLASPWLQLWGRIPPSCRLKRNRMAMTSYTQTVLLK